jgi:hypothetical protein
VDVLSLQGRERKQITKRNLFPNTRIIAVVTTKLVSIVPGTIFQLSLFKHRGLQNLRPAHEKSSVNLQRQSKPAVSSGKNN